MTAVLSSGSTTIERNAAFGAISIEASEDRRIRNTKAPARDGGTGISIKKVVDGRCVKTMVRMRPIRFERDVATREDVAERNAMTEKIVPSDPSSSRISRRRNMSPMTLVRDQMPESRLQINNKA